MFKRLWGPAATLALALAWHTPSTAQTLASSMGIFIYPAKDQSTEQQSKDDYECFTFAKGQTGYDPMNPPQIEAQEPNQQPGGSRLRGAARGAAAGAIIGEIADDDAGKGAAVGATLGTVIPPQIRNGYL